VDLMVRELAQAAEKQLPRAREAQPRPA
jgi:hypothetical protein